MAAAAISHTDCGPGALRIIVRMSRDGSLRAMLEATGSPTGLILRGTQSRYGLSVVKNVKSERASNTPVGQGGKEQRQKGYTSRPEMVRERNFLRFGFDL